MIFEKKFPCDQCSAKFESYDDLIEHAREVHHHVIVHCQECGKEFIHEKDRLHHVREEHEKKALSRANKNLHRDDEKDLLPQDEVDVHRKKFSSNFE